MNDRLKIEDFEVVPDLDGTSGCEKCFFQSTMDGCLVAELEVGIELEKKHGACFDIPEHYYKLKTK